MQTDKSKSNNNTLNNPLKKIIKRTGFEVQEINWLGHHREGINHTHRDVIDIFNWTDTEVTGELALNLTKYFTIEKESEDTDINFNKVVPLILKD